MRSTLKEHYEIGFAVGEARGELRARREVLVELLEVRFGVLPALFAERIASASRDELRTWASRTIAATSVDKVFAIRS